jgi:hypothetical protein
VPSLAPPSHGALAPSVTAIVTFPVHPPANSQSAFYTFPVHLSLLLTLFLLFVSPTDLRDAGKISSSMESDRGSIMNALSAMEREDELVSLFTPVSVFSLLSDRSPFPIVPQLHLLRSQPPGSPCSSRALRRVPCGRRRPVLSADARSNLSPRFFCPSGQPQV